MLKRKKRYKHALINKKKYLITFSSYDETDEVFSDTNIFPIGCIDKMEKIEI